MGGGSVGVHVGEIDGIGGVTRIACRVGVMVDGMVWDCWGMLHDFIRCSRRED